MRLFKINNSEETYFTTGAILELKISNDSDALLRLFKIQPNKKAMICGYIVERLT